jgi:hypothetical protein
MVQCAPQKNPRDISSGASEGSDLTICRGDLEGQVAWPIDRPCAALKAGLKPEHLGQAMTTALNFKLFGDYLNGSTILTNILKAQIDSGAQEEFLFRGAYELRLGDSPIVMRCDFTEAPVTTGERKVLLFVLEAAIASRSGTTFVLSYDSGCEYSIHDKDGKPDWRETCSLEDGNYTYLIIRVREGSTKADVEIRMGPDIERVVNDIKDTLSSQSGE